MSFIVTSAAITVAALPYWKTLRQYRILPAMVNQHHWRSRSLVSLLYLNEAAFGLFLLFPSFKANPVNIRLYLNNTEPWQIFPVAAMQLWNGALGSVTQAAHE